MKYIRTKDGRIVEEHNLEPGLKQTIITIKNKKDNKELTQIVCDDLNDYLEMVVVGEYCKCHKINPKDIKYETTTLFNEVLKQADTIEELCDELVIKYKSEEKPRYVNMTELLKTCKNIGVAFRKHIKWLFTYYKDQLEICNGAIWTDKGLIYVAKMNDKGELELL